MTHDQLRAELVARLTERPQSDLHAAERDAKILLMSVSNMSNAGLFAAAQDLVSPTVVIDAYELCSRCVAGEPIYRAIGKREFHSIEFALSEHTLEPRDDTEALIELVVDHIPDKSRPLSFVDLGTGPGTVALALLFELPNATCVATDLEEGALKTAAQNAQDNGFENRAEFQQGSWFDALVGRPQNSFDFIVSNPPYISSNVVDGLEGNVLNYDPRLALDGGRDGLAAYRDILFGAGRYLKPNGFLALEIGFDQATSVSLLARDTGWGVVEVRKDLGGNDRALILRLAD